MLILHLGDETGSLEQTFLVCESLSGWITRGGVDILEIRPQRGILWPGQYTIRWIYEVIDQTIMLRMEDLVDRTQRNVLVATPITADEVQIEQLIIVGSRRLRCIQTATGNIISIRAACSRGCAVSYIIQEGGINTDHIRRDRKSSPH
jgi:hypothetical protein